MLRFMIRITPKCTGSTPIARAIGTRSGVSTRIDDAVSRNMPTRRSTTLIAISTAHGGISRLLMNAASACGAPPTVSVQENTPAAATMTKTCAVRYIERAADSKISRGVISR